MSWPEVESRKQGSRPRPRTQKKSEAKAKDSFSEDRPSQGQGQECLWPSSKGTSASVLQKKKSLQNIFSGDLQQKTSSKICFQAIYKISTIQKIVLFSSRGQANFRGLETSKPRPRIWPSRPRTSKCVLEAKNALKNSISGHDHKLKNDVSFRLGHCLSHLWRNFFLTLSAVLFLILRLFFETES